MKIFVTFLGALTFACTVFGAGSGEVACKSLIVKQAEFSRFKNDMQAVYLGPYFNKNQRSVGFLDIDKYKSYKFFHVLTYKSNNIGLQIRKSIAIGNRSDVTVLAYHPDENEFPSDLKINALVVFCSTSDRKIDSKMAEYAESNHFLVMATTSMLGE